MFKKLTFRTDDNRWVMDELDRSTLTGGHSVMWVASLSRVSKIVRLFVRIQFKGFFIHIGRDAKL